MDDNDLRQAVAKILEDSSVVSVTIHYPDGGKVFSRPIEIKGGTGSDRASMGKMSIDSLCFPIGSPRCK